MKKARATGKPFLPSPGEFCEWCLPTSEDIGLPSLEDAFNEARRESGKGCQIRQWSHQAVYKAASETGFYDLKTLADNNSLYKDTKRRFTTNYKELVKRVMDGEVLEVPPENRISAPKKTTRTNKSLEAGESTLNNLKGMFDDE